MPECRAVSARHVGVLFCVLLSGCAESLPEYVAAPGGAYGTPGVKLGNKYYVTLPVGSSDEEARRVVQAEAKRRWVEPVQLGGQSLEATELMFFVFNQLDPLTGQPPVPGVSLANMTYRWTPRTGPEPLF